MDSGLASQHTKCLLVYIIKADQQLKERNYLFANRQKSTEIKDIQQDSCQNRNLNIDQHLTLFNLKRRFHKKRLLKLQQKQQDHTNQLSIYQSKGQTNKNKFNKQQVKQFQLNYDVKQVIKMDAVFKPILRGLRKAIKQNFDMFVRSNKQSFKQNRYRWTAAQFEKILRAYVLQLDIDFQDSLDKTLWILGLLVYPNKFDHNKNKLLYDIVCLTLKPEEIEFFKEIFANNDSLSIQTFFASNFIQSMWKSICVWLKKNDCFQKSPRPFHMISYYRLGKQLEQNFNLQMPEWFNKEFMPLQNEIY